jgi:hypothetical protein
MTSRHAEFNAFLRDKINLNQHRVDTLNARVNTQDSFLQGPSGMGSRVTDVIPQGSFALRTIIRPVAEVDFDADILLPFDEQEGWAARAYVEELYKVFEANGTYKGKVTKKKRCVRVQYANEFHVDVVPYVTRSDGLTYITHRTENRYIRSAPEDFTAWFEAQDKTAKGHLTKAVRLVKYLRDRSPAVIPSAVLTALLAEQVNVFTADAFKGVPDTMVRIVNDLSGYLDNLAMKPYVSDHGTSIDLADRWTQIQFQDFKTILRRWAANMQSAIDAQAIDSIPLWQQLFGPDFGVLSQASEAEFTKAVQRASQPGPNEQCLAQFGIIERLDPAFSVTVQGFVTLSKFGRTRRLTNSGNQVSKGKSLIFKVTDCNVPGDYDVYWKVRNYGTEAVSLGQQRGEITKGDGTRQKRETTKYAGHHWVRVWIVKDRVAVATGTQDVIITSGTPT